MLLIIYTYTEIHVQEALSNCPRVYYDTRILKTEKLDILVSLFLNMTEENKDIV